MFQPVNVQGPANRTAQTQQIAQGIAQKMAQRGKLRALLSQTLSGGGASGIMGGSPNFTHGSFEGHAMGARGDVYSPALLPGYGWGRGNGEPGGIEFGSLPGQDPHQSLFSEGVPQAVPPVPGIGHGNGTPPPFAGSNPGGPMVPASAAPTAPTPSAPAAGGGVALPAYRSLPGAPVSNLIPLGNGLHYDPTTDQVVGDGFLRGSA